MRPSLIPTDLPRLAATAAAVVTLAAQVGCHHRRAPRRDDEGIPPVSVVTTSAPPTANKPLPPQDGGSGLPTPYADPPIVHQEAPEEPAYVQAYGAVHRPKVLVFVNRTVTGELVPVNPNVAVRSGLNPYDDRATTYLRAGQYDEAQAKSIDYELIENLLADDLGAGGKVMLISPVAARQRMSEEEVREVQAGRPQMLGELATKLNADVLVQVTARPSQQTDQGLAIRLVAQALNTHGGQAIAFAALDVPPPLTKNRLNDYVRFLSRQLMQGMAVSWNQMGADAVPTAITPPPQPAPIPQPAPAPAPAPAPQPTAVSPIVPQLPTVSPPAPAPTPAPSNGVQSLPATTTPPPSSAPTSRPANPLDLPPPP